MESHRVELAESEREAGRALTEFYSRVRLFLALLGAPLEAALSEDVSAVETKQRRRLKRQQGRRSEEKRHELSPLIQANFEPLTELLEENKMSRAAARDEQKGAT